MTSVFSFFRKARSLASKEEGVAAVEFALLLPVLLILLIGMSETTEALNHDRKVSQVASTMADLVSQAQEISATEISDYFKGADSIMSPYESGPMNIIIASIRFDGSGNPKVDWSRGNKINTPWAKGTQPPIKIPDVVKIPDTFVIVGMTSYNYTPMFASLAQGIFPRAKSMKLEDTYFLRPRLSDAVECKTC